MGVMAAGADEKVGLRGMTGLQWVMLILAVTGELLLTADIYAFAALVPFLSKDLGIRPTQVGFLQGAFAPTYCIGLFLWALLSRRLSARVLYMSGLAMMGSAVLVQALFPHFAVLLAARLFIGFFEGAVWLGIMKLVVEWFEPARRGIVNGMILASASAAIMLDFAIGVPIASALGWEAVFIGIAVITLAVAALSFFVLRPGPLAVAPAAAGAVAKMPVGPIFRSRWLYIAGIAIFGDTFALNATVTWAVPAFIEVQHMSIGYGATLGTLMGVSQIFFLVAGGWLSDRTSRLTVIIGGAVLGCASAVLFTTVTFVPVPFIALVGIVLLSGVAVFSGGAIMSMLSERFPTGLAPAANGYTQFFAVLSNFFAPAALGAAIDSGGGSNYGSAFLIFLAVEVVVMLAVLALLWRLDKRPVVQLAVA